MKPILTLCLAITLAFTLAACDPGITIGDGSGMQSIRIHDGSIGIHKPGVPEADITAAGDLSIGGNPVAVTPAQRDLLKHYYTQVLQVRTDGIAIGKAGAAMAGHAAGSVVSGLVHGNPDSIGPKIQARAEQLKARAFVVCSEAAALGANQNVIANAVPAFRPYASIDATDRSSCHPG